VSVVFGGANLQPLSQCATVCAAVLLLLLGTRLVHVKCVMALQGDNVRAWRLMVGYIYHMVYIYHPHLVAPLIAPRSCWRAQPATSTEDQHHRRVAVTAGHHVHCMPLLCCLCCAVLCCDVFLGEC
jgi:hypothetical protein